MNEGANVLEVRDAFFEACRECLSDPAAGVGDDGNVVGGELFDWLRTCEGDVGSVGVGPGGRMLDFGLPGGPELGDDGDARANGLLRRDVEPWLLKDILYCAHQNGRTRAGALEVVRSRFATRFARA